MGRDFKEGLDYFELDCHTDDKIKLIEAEFGLKGFAIVVKLLQKIYGDKGYYCEWRPENAMLFAKECGLIAQGGVFRQAPVPAGVGVHSQEIGQVAQAIEVSCEVCSLPDEVIRASIKWGIFSGEIFDKYQVLTSRGIQRRYLKATKRRENVSLIEEYLLISVGKNHQNVNINSISADRKAKKVNRNAQRREEERREEEREGDRTPLSPFGKFKNVMLTDSEYDDLCRYENIEIHLDDLSIYLENATKNYDNHYALALKIAREDGWKKKRTAPAADEAPKDFVPTPADIKEKLALFNKSLKG